ncbi:MAG: hypothetical protein ACWA5A_07785 [Marinibacterium sp.]
MNPIQLLRLRRWLRHPPPRRRVLLILGVVAVCIGVWALDRAGFWPDWASAERLKRHPVRILPQQ